MPHQNVITRKRVWNWAQVLVYFKFIGWLLHRTLKNLFKSIIFTQHFLVYFLDIWMVEETQLIRSSCQLITILKSKVKLFKQIYFFEIHDAFFLSKQSWHKHKFVIIHVQPSRRYQSLWTDSNGRRRNKWQLKKHFQYASVLQI